MQRPTAPVAVAVSLLAAALALCIAIAAVNSSSDPTALLSGLSSAGHWPEPSVGQVLKKVKVEHLKQHSRRSSHINGQNEPMVSAKTEQEAHEQLKGTPLAELSPLHTQKLRYTGSYGDTSYVVQGSEGDPATVYAHNSIWPGHVDPKMPYFETVHGDGTPFMQPLTVYAPPGGTVVSSVMPGTSARPPIPTRFAQLPEADNSPLDNTVYQCQPSGYMVGPTGYHCVPACKDSSLWRSDYGDCSVYRSTPITEGAFKDYCGADKDIAGVPAAVACPVSCGTCGIGLCYEHDKFKSCKLSTYSTDVDESP
eukprot:CAMPEP_0184292462 /NCGR_PEP_ID=MMETSP1049-20130417/4241_1 /TAXON_ID=77928 /ORGANISM="Proteomonas sulcata, Strain CCMP704" /LENGTH=308 /DNA_ID=CAMNT_0026600247 /DNA_START=37 /DNA_END=963 /DNA_ORIENTATION=-